MIGFFPDPYPDELLYSACARFGDRSNYRNVATVARELFGSPTGMAVVSFPKFSGIYVCPDHSVFLEASLAGCRERESSNAFISAERTVNDVATRAIDPRNRDHNILLKLAQDAKWLLSPGSPSRRQRCRLRPSRIEQILHRCFRRDAGR
jgi:hypothetical protein